VVFLALFLISCLLQIFVPVDYMALRWADPNIWHRLLTIITHMLGHGGWLHLAGNYSFTAMYAIWLEKQVGARKFLKFFLIGGLCALLGQFLTLFPNPHQIGVIGSSGADFALLGAALYLQGTDRWTKIVSRITIAYMGGTQLYLAWMSILYPGMFNVAFAAHLGGLVGGVTLAYFYQKRLDSLKS